MDIRPFTGDMLSQTSGFLVHGVNCQGVMGSGIALTIRETYPEAYESYKELCDRTEDKESLLGKVQFICVTPKLCIVNLFSQGTFGTDGSAYAKPWAIEKGLKTLSSMVHNTMHCGEMGRVHLPQIGGVRGGLDFDTEVMPIITSVAIDYPDITYGVWTYDGTKNA